MKFQLIWSISSPWSFLRPWILERKKSVFENSCSKLSCNCPTCWALRIFVFLILLHVELVIKDVASVSVMKKTMQSFVIYSSYSASYSAHLLCCYAYKFIYLYTVCFLYEWYKLIVPYVFDNQVKVFTIWSTCL